MCIVQCAWQFIMYYVHLLTISHLGFLRRNSPSFIAISMLLLLLLCCLLSFFLWGLRVHIGKHLDLPTFIPHANRRSEINAIDMSYVWKCVYVCARESAAVWWIRSPFTFYLTEKEYTFQCSYFIFPSIFVRFLCQHIARRTWSSTLLSYIVHRINKSWSGNKNNNTYSSSSWSFPVYIVRAYLSRLVVAE